MVSLFHRATIIRASYTIQGYSIIQGINGKPIYDFLLVINANLPPILHRYCKIYPSDSKCGPAVSLSVYSVSGAVMVSNILMVLLTVKVLYEICQMGSSGLCGPLAVTVSILDTPHWSFQHRSTR